MFVGISLTLSVFLSFSFSKALSFSFFFQRQKTNKCAKPAVEKYTVNYVICV